MLTIYWREYLYMFCVIKSSLPWPSEELVVSHISQIGKLVTRLSVTITRIALPREHNSFLALEINWSVFRGIQQLAVFVNLCECNFLMILLFLWNFFKSYHLMTKYLGNGLVSNRKLVPEPIMIKMTPYVYVVCNILIILSLDQWLMKAVSDRFVKI